MPVTPEMILVTVAPAAAERARRLEHAIRLLQSGAELVLVRRTLREHYSISRVTAWRIVDMAIDMVGER